MTSQPGGFEKNAIHFEKTAKVMRDRAEMMAFLAIAMAIDINISAHCVPARGYHNNCDYDVVLH